MADDGLDNVVSKAVAAPLTSLDGVSVRISRREICNAVLVDRRSALLKELDDWNANAVVAGPAREERIAAAATTMVFMVVDAQLLIFALFPLD